MMWILSIAAGDGSDGRDGIWLSVFLQVFRPRTPQEALDLISRLLEYTPSARLSPLQACAHAFFDDLRDPSALLPNGRELPPLFNFTEEGKKS